MAKFKRMNPDGTTSEFEVATPKPRKLPVRSTPKTDEAPPAAKSRLVRRRKPVEEKPVSKLPKASKANFEDEPDIHNDRKYIPEVDPDEIFSYPQEPVRRKKTVTPPATDESAYERTHPQRPRTVRKAEPEYVEKPQYVEKPRRTPVYEDEEYDDEEEYDRRLDSDVRRKEEYDDYDEYEDEEFVEEEDEDYDVYEAPQRDPYYGKKRAPRYDDDDQYFEPVKRPKRNPSAPPKKPIEPKKPSIAKIEKEVVEKIKYEKPYVLDRKGITLLTNTIIEALAQNFVSRDELDLAVERSLQNMVIENDLNQ